MRSEPQYDEHQFAGRKSHAVSATKTHEGWNTTGISFNDFGTMHVSRRKVQQQRRKPTPAWSMDDKLLRQRVLHFLESRFFLSNDKSLSDTERLNRINAEAQRRLPELRKTLTRRLIAYNEEAKAGATPGRLQRLQVECQNHDSEIVLLERGIAAVVTAVVYYYFRAGWNSVEIANNLRLKSPMVRVWLWRLNNRSADRIYTESKSVWPAEKLKALLILRLRRLTFKNCAKIFGVTQNTVRKQWISAYGDLKVKVDRPEKREPYNKPPKPRPEKREPYKRKWKPRPRCEKWTTRGGVPCKAWDAASIASLKALYEQVAFVRS